METLGNFGIFLITLKPGRIHLFEETLSKVPHREGKASFNDIKVLLILFEDFIVSYEYDQIFRLIVNPLGGECPTKAKQKLKLENLVTMITLDWKKLLCLT